ncbi:MAG: glutamate-1-semialdehyde 2,1-aminomutase [Chloroflexi bacterium GWC2_73_18]|nr:MAG: glutamate-1-semialdehyde 2,1-aminomutase [Chloroflexi bacterium GWC2_73_18]
MDSAARHPSATKPRPLERDRIRELLRREEERLNQRTIGSKVLFERARQSLTGGVGSSYQSREPWPIYVSRGDGAYVWDVDGNRYIDYHNGFGSMVQGHAHPVISEAVARRLPLGTHFGAATEDGVWVAEELKRRFGLPQWRYTNSGTEATMDAIRIARAFTRRDAVLKMVGSFHGHHDYVMVSIGMGYNQLGDRENYASTPYGAGIPKPSVDMTVPLPFNDADAMERRIERLVAEGRPPACLIMEAVLMNLGVILPKPGYLERVREITRKYGILWIVDEVKTGLQVATGGATELYGLEPDLVTLAKALGGGLPSGAIGGTDEVMEVVRNGSVFQVGTYNGNPLVMAAARASLEGVLTPEVYLHLRKLNDRLIAGLENITAEFGLPGYAVGINSKGVYTFSSVEIVDYETFKANQDAELNQLAWLYNMNRGIFMTPGREEEWTLSVRHTDADVDQYVAVFREMARDLKS